MCQHCWIEPARIVTCQLETGSASTFNSSIIQDVTHNFCSDSHDGLASSRMTGCCMQGCFPARIHCGGIGTQRKQPCSDVGCDGMKLIRRRRYGAQVQRGLIKRVSCIYLCTLLAKKIQNLIK